MKDENEDAEVLPPVREEEEGGEGGEWGGWLETFSRADTVVEIRIANLHNKLVCCHWETTL